jgi:hypothetical protein
MAQELLQQVSRPGNRDLMDCHMNTDQELFQQITRPADRAMDCHLTLTRNCSWK